MEDVNRAWVTRAMDSSDYTYYISLSQGQECPHRSVLMAVFWSSHL